MPKITINNHCVELPLSLFLDAISSSVIALYNSYEMLFGLQILGRPSTFRSQFGEVIARDTDFLSMLQGQVKDRILLRALCRLKKHLSLFDEISDELHQVITSNTEQCSVTSTEFMDMFPPEWVDQPPYNQLLTTSSQRMLAIVGDVEAIIRRISRLRKMLGSASSGRVEQEIMQRCKAMRELIRDGAEKGYFNALRQIER